jgi:hypothetical protein
MAIFELTTLCSKTDAQLEKHHAIIGNYDAATEWLEVNLCATRALLSIQALCECVTASGITSETIADVAGFASALKQFEREPMTRQ